MSKIRKIISEVDLNNRREKQSVINEVSELLKNEGYNITEIDAKRPWGGFIRLNNNDAEKFVEQFFNDLNIETARLNNPKLSLSPKILIVAPRQRISWQYHHRRAERWNFINEGFYHRSKDDLEGKKIAANAGDEIQFDTKERHRGVGHPEKYTLVAEIWQHTNPNEESNEEDIVRLQDDYNRDMWYHKDMITVIIAGGSGTRLWPLSTSKYPKHLLKLTGERTMVQQAYDRAKELGNTIYVITEKSHADLVKKQLPDLPEEAFLIEPGRRGTANCILLALDYISKKHNNDEPIALIHSDHTIRDVEGFKRSFGLAAKVSTERNEITLIGIEPTFPSTGFGYIQRDGVIDDSAGVYKVESFKEKPDYETAKKFVEAGDYFWNCGYFVGTVNTFKNEINRSAPSLQKNIKILQESGNLGDKKYDEAYLSLENEVIDIALIEKAKSLAMVVARFDWVDVGSFKDLHDTISKDDENNRIDGENIHAIGIENSYIRNEEDKPIAVIGLNNIVVVNTPDGILVSRKDISHRTGEVAKEIQQNEKKEGK